MSSNFRPMLAAKLKKGETYDQKLPDLDWNSGIVCTPKLDGIRIIMHPTLGPVTRSLKRLPNKYLREKCEALYPAIAGFDGEMILGDHEDSGYSFQKTVSAIMSFEGEPKDVIFHVFDDMSINEKYVDRINNADLRVHRLKNSFLKYVPEEYAYSIDKCYEIEEAFLERNYEGVMLRHPDGLYKQGRSTFKQQGLIAVKRFEDAEAMVTGMLPLMRNNNEATVDNLGLQVRSSHKDNKEADDLLGKLIVVGCANTRFAGEEFNIGSGFSEADRIEIWRNPDKYVGKFVTFKYQAHGIKTKPRQAIFKSFRDGF